MSKDEVLDLRRKPSRISVERLADGFGERTRIMSQCEVLARRGTISPRQERAATRIYQCWSLGVCGARNGETTGNGNDPSGYSDAQLQALREYRIIRDAVGGRLWSVVFSVAVEDLSPFRWANERGGGVHPKGAVALLRVGLDTAADAIGD